VVSIINLTLAGFGIWSFINGGNNWLGPLILLLIGAFITWAAWLLMNWIEISSEQSLTIQRIFWRKTIQRSEIKQTELRKNSQPSGVNSYAVLLHLTSGQTIRIPTLNSAAPFFYLHLLTWLERSSSLQEIK